MAAGGAAASAATNLWRTRVQRTQAFSWSSLARDTVIGGALGAAGGVAGRVAQAVAPAASRVASAAASRVSTGVSNAASRVSTAISNGASRLGNALRSRFGRTPGSSAGNVTVYRVEGAANARLSIGSSGEVSIGGDSMLYLNFGDRARALEYLAQKQAQPGMADAAIKSFEVPQSYADSLFARSVPQRGGAGAPVQQVDLARTDRSLGLASSEFADLACAIIPGSGRC